MVWPPGLLGVPASGWLPAGLHLHSSFATRLPTWGDTLGQCPPTEVGEGLLTPEARPCSSPRSPALQQPQMPTWHRGPCPQALLPSEGWATVPIPGPEPQREQVLLRLPSLSGTQGHSPPPPHQPARGGGGAGQEPRGGEGRSAHCRPAQGSVMSLPVLRSGRGPGCFSGQLELE